MPFCNPRLLLLSFLVSLHHTISPARGTYTRTSTTNSANPPSATDRLHPKKVTGGFKMTPNVVKILPRSDGDPSKWPNANNNKKQLVPMDDTKCRTRVGKWWMEERGQSSAGNKSSRGSRSAEDTNCSA